MLRPSATDLARVAALALVLLAVPPCGGDDGAMTPPDAPAATRGAGSPRDLSRSKPGEWERARLSRSTFVLRHDGEQDNSPNLPGQTTYVAAARFTPVDTAGLVGGTLSEVLFYIQTVPDTCRVKIYGEGTPSTPGPLLYSADIAASPASWNTHVLASTVTIPSGDIWIGIEFRDTQLQRTIGCDPGPAVPNGNWYYSSSSGVWVPFFVGINWNIRGVVRT